MLPAGGPHQGSAQRRIQRSEYTRGAQRETLLSIRDGLILVWLYARILVDLRRLALRQVADRGRVGKLAPAD